MSLLVSDWRQYPALLYGLSLFLGLIAAFSWHSSLVVPLLFLFYPLLFPSRWPDLFQRLLLSLLIMIAAFCYARFYHQLPQLPDNGGRGVADIEICSVTSEKTRFSDVWTYRGTVNLYTPLNSHSEEYGKHFAFKMSLPCKEGTPPLDGVHYRIPVTIKKIAPLLYHIKPDPNNSWYPVDDAWNFARWRYQAKKIISSYIHQHIHDATTAHFLSGIATGNFDDYHTAFEFGRFGLQHIMAISGFHFGIISGFLLLCLRFWMPYRIATLIVLMLMSGYFFFLGYTPSIMRSWIMIGITFAGTLLGKSGNALNSLGVAMIAVLIADPPCCLSLAFQLSFLITAAILLFYPTFSSLLQSLWKKRHLSEMINMDRSNQYGYLVLNMLRESIALTIAVSIVAIPATLFYFHQFPWMGLLYNLFFPAMITLSMILLILGCTLCWLPPIANCFHYLNESFTRFTLDFVFNLPTTFDYYFRVDSIDLLLLSIYLSVAFLVGISSGRKQANFNL